MGYNKSKEIFNAFDLLPGNKKLRAKAKLTFEERVNHIWTKVRFDGKIVLETAESNFETGEAPGFIPESNIAFSYPLPNQINFYPQEYPKGFIQLVEGQPYLFYPGKDWLQKIRMTESLSGQFLEADLAYNQQSRLITYDIPNGFQNSKLYRFEIVNIPRMTTVMDQNVEKINKELTIDESAGTATLTTQSV